MFILRKITGGEEKRQLNWVLGDSYGLTLKEEHPEEFEKMLKFYEPCHDVYGFISYDGGKILWLYPNQKNYIMTESGKTFANISQ